MPTLPPMTSVVFIIWRDAVQGYRRTVPAEDMPLVTRMNVGWILHEDRERIILCRSRCGADGEECVAIPVSAITERLPVVEMASIDGELAEEQRLQKEAARRCSDASG